MSLDITMSHSESFPEKPKMAMKPKPNTKPYHQMSRNELRKYGIDGHTPSARPRECRKAKIFWDKHRMRYNPASPVA